MLKMKKMKKSRFSRKSNSRRLLAFIHIPKTAGSSFRYILQKQYGHVFNKISGFSTKTFTNHLSKYPHTVIEAHQHYSPIRPWISGVRFNKATTTWLTFLRNPIERIISAFYYQYPRIQLDKQFSLKEFIEKNIIPPSGGAANNAQTWYLSNGTSDIKLAKYNLKHNIIFGITEKFDQSLRLFKKELNWKDSYQGLETLNTNSSRPSIDEVPGEVIKLIRKKNQLDLELYAFAVQLFNQRMQSVG